MRLLRKVGGNIGKTAGYLAFRAIPGHKYIRRKFDKVNDAYERGKTFINGHEPEIRAATYLARRLGGDKGKKIADAVDKAQGKFKKVTGKIDKIRDTAKDIISK